MALLRSKKRTQFAVLGAGRFGAAMAKELQESGNDVLVIDSSESKINEISQYVTHCIIADATDEEVLKSAAIKNMDVVIIGMGASMQSSIFATLICKELGVPYIVCKASNFKHKQILEKMGADLVVIPEVATAKRIALRIMHPGVCDIMNLQQGYSIVEINTPKKWQGENLIKLNLRKEYGASVILIKKTDDKVVKNPGGDYIFENGDTAVIGIDTDHLDNFIDKIK